jgi:hypothetical protein
MAGAIAGLLLLAFYSLWFWRKRLAQKITANGIATQEN